MSVASHRRRPQSSIITLNWRCRDGVDDVPEHAGQPPPLPRSDDDAEGEEGETEPVATVFGFEVRSGGADAADGAAGDVRNTHPRATSSATGRGGTRFSSPSRRAGRAGLARGCILRRAARTCCARLRRGRAGARRRGRRCAGRARALGARLRRGLLRDEDAVVRWSVSGRHPARLVGVPAVFADPRRDTGPMVTAGRLDTFESASRRAGALTRSHPTAP